MPEPATDSTRPQTGRVARRRWFAGIMVLALGVGLLLAGEVAARWRGHRPFHPRAPALRVEPPGSLFVALPGGGFAHRPGAFRVTLPTDFSFQVTHGADGLRITHPPREPGATHRRPELWILGCSLTHGWALNDAETFPWRVQSALPDFEVVNGGVSGYGTLHSRLQFQELLVQRGRPSVVVVAYGLFHDYRNTFVRIWQKGFVPYNQLATLSYPCARFAKFPKLAYEVVPATYAEWPGQRRSALVHAAEQFYNRREAEAARSHEVSRELMRLWAGLCAKEGIRLLVAGLSSDAGPMLDWCRQNGIAAVDISVPLSDPANTNAPHDNHPNAESNRRYAERLVASLKLLPEISPPAGR